MAEIGAASNSTLDSLSLSKRAGETGAKNDELGQDAFLQLLVTQLSNQDPLSPSENGDFIAQLAQFSSVEGITNLNTSVSDMAGSLKSSQALQASALVGRSVRLPTESTQLSPQGDIKGDVELPAATQQITIRVYDDSGQLVSNQNITGGTNSDKSSKIIPAGKTEFTWDGTRTDGSKAPAGRYRVEAEALINGTTSRMGTNLNANVDSVTIGQGENISINVAGVGAMPLGSVTEIY